MKYVLYFFQKLFPVTIVLLTLSGVAYEFSTTHLPLETKIGDITVNFQDPEEAKRLLEDRYAEVPPHTLTVIAGKNQVASSSAQLGAQYEYRTLLREFEKIQARPLGLKKIVQSTVFFFQKKEVAVPVIYDEEKVRGALLHLKAQTDVVAVQPGAVLATSGAPQSLKMQPGKKGLELQVDRTLQQVMALQSGSSAVITATVEETGSELTPEQVEAAKQLYTQFVGKTLVFTAERFSTYIRDKDLIALIQPDGKLSEEAVVAELATWRERVETPPQEPVFKYDEHTLAVKEFTPPRDGRSIVLPEFMSQVSQYVASVLQDAAAKPAEKKVSAQTSLPLPLELSKPKQQLSDTNTLGIRERIGFGESYYAHSIPNRIHNVAITAERISLKLIKPGEEFSFNKTLGDVSAKTGYRSAYVIKNGQTALGDGGGVCQVSTTLFRSVLNAGLQVTRRLPHSYRVSYYELDSKPGVDATVYSGETDFRFMNDTHDYILVYTHTESSNLYMYVELYGTSDGRTAEITDHKTWNSRPPLPTQYIPDSTLPKGKLVQVDWSASGIDASFKNVIKDKNGVVIREDTYVSKYRPWAAKYLQGV